MQNIAAQLHEIVNIANQCAAEGNTAEAIRILTHSDTLKTLEAYEATTTAEAPATKKRFTVYGTEMIAHSVIIEAADEAEAYEAGEEWFRDNVRNTWEVTDCEEVEA